MRSFGISDLVSRVFAFTESNEKNVGVIESLLSIALVQTSPRIEGGIPFLLNDLSFLDVFTLVQLCKIAAHKSDDD